MGKLTIAKVNRLQKPGLHGDGDTLFLNISKTGGKSWIQRVTVRGRRRDIGLGPLWQVSLAEARDKAIDNRRLIRAGGSPLAERERKAPTFAAATDAVLAINRDRWRGSRTEQIWRSRLERHAFPVFGDLPVSDITQDDIMRCLEPIWTSKPETGRKVRMMVRKVMQWAEAHGHVDRNVAGEAINGALPSMTIRASHHRSLPYAETGDALRTIAASAAGQAVKLCFRLVVLTACRSGEARHMTWGEVDMDAALWTIPADRTKTGAEHRVPLSDAARAVLAAARMLADGSGLVFPSPRTPGKPLSDMTLTRVLRVTGLADKATVHGFRSTFRVWASETTDADHAVMELCLGHHVGSKVERAYARSDLADRRRALMEQWADYVARPLQDAGDSARSAGEAGRT